MDLRVQANKAPLYTAGNIDLRRVLGGAAAARRRGLLLDAEASAQAHNQRNCADSCQRAQHNLRRGCCSSSSLGATRCDDRRHQMRRQAPQNRAQPRRAPPQNASGWWRLFGLVVHSFWIVEENNAQRWNVCRRRNQTESSFVCLMRSEGGARRFIEARSDQKTAAILVRGDPRRSAAKDKCCSAEEAFQEVIYITYRESHLSSHAHVSILARSARVLLTSTRVVASPDRGSRRAESASTARRSCTPARRCRGRASSCPPPISPCPR
jgi:hypothetical protein